MAPSSGRRPRLHTSGPVAVDDQVGAGSEGRRGPAATPGRRRGVIREVVDGDEEQETQECQPNTSLICHSQTAMNRWRPGCLAPRYVNRV